MGKRNIWENKAKRKRGDIHKKAPIRKSRLTHIITGKVVKYSVAMGPDIRENTVFYCF